MLEKMHLVMVGWLAGVGGVGFGCGSCSPPASGGPEPGDAGTMAFLGTHAVTATFTSFSQRMSGPQGMSVGIAVTNADGRVELAAGDDPNAIWSARAGTVTGTVAFSGGGGSGFASFSSPYCHLTDCP